MADNEEKLVKMLKYVSEHNDFYKNRIKEYGISNPLDITQWPVLTRKELQENRYNMFSDGHRRLFFNQQLIKNSSSGSTGVPVDVFWSRQDYYNSVLPLWKRRKEWYNILPTDKQVSFALSQRYDNSLQKIKHNVESFIDKNRLIINATNLKSSEMMTIAVRNIKDFNPKWLFVQPVVLKGILSECKRSNTIFDNLAYIEVVGESLSDELRKDSRDYFGANVSSMYGSQENNGMALECKNARMHILSENVYIEHSGVITNLNNHTMPLIRYDQGDTIKFSENNYQCDCSFRSKIINCVCGRKNKTVIYNEKKIESYELTSLIANINNIYNYPIIMFRFEYKTRQKLMIVKLMFDTKFLSWKFKIMNEIKDELLNLFNMESIVVEEFDDNIFQTKQSSIIIDEDDKND